MNHIFAFRGLQRPAYLLTVGIGASVCFSGSILLRGSHVRLDGSPVGNTSFEPARNRIRRSRLSPEVVQQISSGSVAGQYSPLALLMPFRTIQSCMCFDNLLSTGLLAGLVTALFSRTLVFLGGAIALSFHVRIFCSACLWNPVRWWTWKSSTKQASFLISYVLTSQFASRYGLDLSHAVGIDRIPGVSAIFQAGAQKPWFTSTFATMYILAAFCRL